MTMRGIPQQFIIDCKITNQRVHVAEQRFQLGTMGSSHVHQQVERECQYTDSCRGNGIDCIFAYGSRDPRR